MTLNPQRVPGEPSGGERFRLVLPTDVEQIADAVEAVLSCCHRHRALTDTERFKLCTVAAEAITNAISYGNNHDPSYRVTVDLEMTAENIVLGVTDEGEGFDPATVGELSDSECHEATRGRGLYIIRRLSETVAFNDRGNTIWMTLPRQ